MVSLAIPTDLLRVVVVEDQSLAVEGMRRSGRRDIQIVGHAVRATGGAAIAARQKPDVVAMDLGGVGTVWPSVRNIAVELGVPVLIVTGESDPTLADMALANGASGIASKGANSEETIAALHLVAMGREHWDTPWHEQVVAIRSKQVEPLAPLTETDRQLLNAIGVGLTGEKAAEFLAVSEEAFQESLALLRRRYGAVNDADLILRLVRFGLLKGGDLL